MRFWYKGLVLSGNVLAESRHERGENVSQRDTAVPPDDVPLKLNPLLTAGTFSDDFSRKGRVRIADILTDAAAQRLLRALQQETPWGLIYNDGKKVQEFKYQEFPPKTIRRWQLPHGKEPTHDFSTSITCVGYWRTGRCIRGRGITWCGWSSF
jgi:hypothetical protein